MKYIKKGDLKKLKATLEDLFSIKDIDLDLIRRFVEDLGMDDYLQDTMNLVGYKRILQGIEKYDTEEIQ